MKSLTLHALDDQLAAQIKRRARVEEVSMNTLAKRILAEGLGIKVRPAGRHLAEFEKFCGSWSKEETRAIEARLDDFEKIDPAEWQ